MPRPRSLKRPMRRANKRLKLMGLDPQIVIDKDEAFMIVPLQQLVDLISKKIVYKNKEVLLEDNKLVIRVWRDKTTGVIE